MHSAVHCVFSAVAQLDAVCQLAVMFIANVSISGYSVTANVHSKVDALLSVTSRHILTLLHDKCIKLVNSYVHRLLYKQYLVFSTQMQCSYFALRVAAQNSHTEHVKRQGDHLSGKPGNVRDLTAVREMSGRSCLKLFIVSCIFASIQVFSTSTAMA